MSDTQKKIIIKRYSFQGKCGKFRMCLSKGNKKSFALYGCSFKIYSRIRFRHPSEERAASQIVNMFVRITGLVKMRSKILEGFEELYDDDLIGDCELTMKIPVPEAFHVTCEKNSDDLTEESQIDQCEISQELKEYDEDSRVVKFFDKNSCPVCFGTYKEILDRKLHIVVPTCGHPLCCKCADNIVESISKQCPCCRRKLTSDSYNLMKFNADLELDQQDQKVYL